MMDLDDGIGNDSSGFDGGINPAWNEALTHIPEDVRDNVLPVFKKWDDNFQGQVQKVHSEYEPYKNFKEQGIGAEDIEMALGIARAISDNPRQVWETMANSYGWADQIAQNAASGQGSSEQNVQAQGNQNGDAGSFELPGPVREQLEQLQKGQDTIAQIILQKKQEEEQAQEDALLREELAQLKTQHGNFHEGFVLSQMQMGRSGEDAVKEYQNMIQQEMIERNRPKPPRLLSGGNGAGIPGEGGKLDPGKMTPGQINNVVANYLRDAKAAER